MGIGAVPDAILAALKGHHRFGALTSHTQKGVPRVVPILRPGAGVVTTRAHVQFVVTKNGAVDLYGKTLSERAELLMSIAHPDDQESLERAWHEARA